MRTTVIALFWLVLFAVLACGQGEETPEAKLEITGKLVEIPGKFPPNELYDYVYILKYDNIKVIKGEYKGKTILVGHYNPRIPRTKIKDKMNKVIKGTLKKFVKGDTHKMILGVPLEDFWDDAVIDEYFDDDEGDRYFAVTTDLVKD